MGQLFTLTDDIRAIAAMGIDDLIDQLGKPCRLYYPVHSVPCSSCSVLPIGNRQENPWISGGVTPNPNQNQCPTCGGASVMAEQETEVITMLCNWNPKQWVLSMPEEVHVPYSIVQTKAYMTDVPKILRSREMVIETQIEGVNVYNFKLLTEPIDKGSIIQGRYAVMLWERGG